MKRLTLVLAALSLPLASCGGSPVTGGPAVIADQTVLDEQIGISLTLAYTAAARAAALAIETGMVKDPVKIARIGELDKRAYAAVQAVRAAYLAGNSASYLAAISRAQAAVGALLEIVKRN